MHLSPSLCNVCAVICFAVIGSAPAFECRYLWNSTTNQLRSQHLRRFRRYLDDSSEPRAWRSTQSGAARLKFTIVNFPSRTTLSQEAIRQDLRQAMAVWSCYSQVSFQEVSQHEYPDIFISFESQKHGYFSFFSKQRIPYQCQTLDGQGGHLAHAFIPRGRNAYDKMGNLHFDDDEIWSKDSRTGTNFFYIAIHEMGHVLGLEHSPVAGNIMNSFIDQTIRNEDIDLGPWDKNELRKRYGWRPDCLQKSWKRYFKESPKRLALRSADHAPKHRYSCRNLYSSCQRYSLRHCRHGSAIGDWLIDNCRRTCGTCYLRFQPSQRCRNRFHHCSRYPTEICFARHHRYWMQKHCQKYCGLCS